MNVAETKLGRIDALALVTMIADVEAQDNSLELLQYFADDAECLIPSEIMIQFGSGMVANFAVSGRRYQLSDDGGVDWQTVTRLKLMAIGARHGT